VHPADGRWHEARPRLNEGINAEVTELVAARGNENDVSTGSCLVKVPHHLEPARNAAAAFAGA
jgi:hypothetical protein